jgi:hypothetical protein
MFALAPIHCGSVFRNRSPRQLVGGIASDTAGEQATLAKEEKQENEFEEITLRLLKSV